MDNFKQSYIKRIMQNQLRCFLTYAIFCTLFLAKSYATVAVQQVPNLLTPYSIKQISIDSEQDATHHNQAWQYIQTANINKEMLTPLDQQALKALYENQLPLARQLISQTIDETDFSQHPRLLVNRLLIRAVIDRAVGANIAALQDLQFAFRLAASNNQQDLLADVALTIASIHQTRNEHSIALSYAQQALVKYQQLDISERITQSMLMSVSSLLATQQLDSASIALQTVKPFVESSDVLQYQAWYFQYLGELQLYQEKITNSIDTLKSATNIVPAYNQSQLATVHLLLSQAYTQKDDMNLAIEHLVVAFTLADNIDNAFYLNQALHLHRANLLGQLNEFEAAFRVTQDILKARELNQPIAQVKQMLDMHANFQLEMQQQENALLKQDNLLQAEQIEDKQMLNSLYFVVIALLVFISALLLLLFLRGRKHRKHLEKIAHTDALTGLFSRSHVLDLLAHHQHLFARSKQQYCVAIIDLDYFKKVNDTHGHQMGDNVLQLFGDTCRTSFRKTDLIGRIGGEEFLFILPNTQLQEALDVLHLFNTKLPNISNKLALSFDTTASIGLVAPISKESPVNIIKRADKALYEAKRKGRNQVVIGNNLAPLQKSLTKVN